MNILKLELSPSGIENLIETYFTDTINITDQSKMIFDTFMFDVDFASSVDPSQNTPQIVLNNKCKGILAIFCYRVANHFYALGFKEQAVKLMEDVGGVTSIDIHPQAKIDKGFFIDHGANVVIGQTCEIGENCLLFNDVVLGNNSIGKNKNVKRHPTIKNNVTICAGARVLGDIVVGNNCFISGKAVVLDSVPDNTNVKIVNQLQITSNSKLVPSQKLIVFGVVPKFKNTIYIFGDGFYNPTVLIKLKDIELDYLVTYWDKNKIIVKIKNATPVSGILAKQAKLILLSNSEKAILTNSFGLTKALISLQN